MSAYILYIVYVIIVILVIIYYTQSTKEGMENGSAVVVMYSDFRRNNPEFARIVSGRLDYNFKINLKEVRIDSGNHKVELWQIYDSPNSNSVSINSDYYRYLRDGIKQNTSTFKKILTVGPNQKIDLNLDHQVSKVRLLITPV